MMCLAEPIRPSLTTPNLVEIQKEAGVYEQSQRIHKGATGKDGLWRAHNGRVVAPAKLLAILMAQAHGPAHESKRRTIKNIETDW